VDEGKNRGGFIHAAGIVLSIVEKGKLQSISMYFFWLILSAKQKFLTDLLESPNLPHSHPGIGRDPAPLLGLIFTLLRRAASMPDFHSPPASELLSLAWPRER
jgi:hypothetical protein